MASNLLLRRIPRLYYCINRQRTYHVFTYRRATEITTRCHHGHGSYIGLRATHCSRLYSTGGSRHDKGNDIEMFRDTPTFAPEWSDPAAASTDSSSTITDTIVENSEVVTNTIGGYGPVGLLQTALEFAHTTLDMPWWMAIASATIIIRMALFPLAVKMQVNAATIANINPQAQEIHQKLVAAKATGDKKAEAEFGMEILKLYQDNNCHPAKMFIMPFAQMPVFISFLMALRGMAQLPVESMTTGGLWWFTDLTVPDSSFALPLIACATFLSNVELGGEGGAANTNETHKRMKLFLRASAFLILPVSITFPSALFCYWVTNSLLSTIQILVFKIPGVKTTLGIPKIIRHQK